MTEQPAVAADANAIRVAFVPTLDDQVHANREILRRRGWRRWTEPVLLLAAAVFVTAQARESGWMSLFSGAMFITITLAFVFGLRLLVRPITRGSIAWQRRQNPHMLGAMSYTFSDAGVHVQSPLGTSHMPWSSFVLARETPDILLLYFARRAAYFVPRRALREVDEGRLCALIASHLGARAQLMKPTDD